jgi:uncharacterized cupredoxin-like copper-binding protein
MRKLLTIGAVLGPIAVAAAVPSIAADPLQVAAAPKQIEIVMKDKAYSIKGGGAHTVVGEATAIVLRNEDTVTHGFVSPLFNAVPVKIEGEAVLVFAKGSKGFRIDPGKTATLHFMKGSTADRETQRYPFWCDLHEESMGMKGEMLILETGGETGGG